MPPKKQPTLRCDMLLFWVRKHLPLGVDPNMRVYAEYLQVNERTLWRWKVEDIPFHTADAIATSIGIHPAEIWGEDYWEAA